MLISPKQGGDGKTALWEYVLACAGLWDVPGNGGFTPARNKTTAVRNGKGWTLVSDCRRLSRSSSFDQSMGQGMLGEH